MPKRTIGLLILWILLSVSLVTLQASAQDGTNLDTLEVALWPEYDRPAVLVIYRIILGSGTSLPADLTFRIPATAGDPNAVAVRDADGGLYNIAYERQPAGEWSLINFTATLSEIQLEYYDPGLIKEDTSRSFEYTWPGDYAVDDFTIQVQQPFDASNTSISPAATNSITGQDGLVYFNEQIGSLPNEQTFDLKVSYQKSSDTLSAESLQVQPSAPVAETTSTLRTQALAALPWILGTLGVVLIIGGGVWYWQSGKGKEQAKPRRRRKPTTHRETISEAGHIYCHQCGKRAASGDLFCRVCGSKLRIE